MLFDKGLVSAVKTGQIDKRELVNELLRNNNIIELANKLADYIIAEEDAVSPIVVSQQEYSRITSLFRIRGMRSDGTNETRGKKIK